MRHSVVVKVGAGGEPLSAVLALVRLLPRVDAAVCVETARCAEALAAHHAHVGLFSCERRQTNNDIIATRGLLNRCQEIGGKVNSKIDKNKTIKYHQGMLNKVID